MESVFYDQKNEDLPKENKETFGFKTPHTPHKHEMLEKFEDDMYTLISSIEFSKGKSDFQRKLDEDLRGLKTSGKVILEADKTTNMYLISKTEHSKLLKENVTATYKKSTFKCKRVH